MEIKERLKEALFAFVVMLCAVITLVVVLFDHKK